MARRNRRRVRYLSDISSLSELRQARREVDLKLWYAGEKLTDDLSDTFSVDNLMSIIAPPGSLTEKIIDGFSMGLTTLRGIINAIGLFRGR